MAGKILKDACRRISVEGVSTHSFRRTALTMMSSAGIPLRVSNKLRLEINLPHQTLREDALQNLPDYCSLGRKLR